MKLTQHCKLTICQYFLKNKSDHITSALKILLWLSLSLRVKAEVLTVVSKALNDVPPQLLFCMHLPLLPLPLTRLLPPDFLLFPNMPGCSSLRASAHPLRPPSLLHLLQLRCLSSKRSSVTALPTAWRFLLAACIALLLPLGILCVRVCILCLPPPPQGYKHHNHKHRVCLTASLSLSGLNLENKNISDDFKEGI